MDRMKSYVWVVSLNVVVMVYKVVSGILCTVLMVEKRRRLDGGNGGVMTMVCLQFSYSLVLAEMS